MIRLRARREVAVEQRGAEPLGEREGDLVVQNHFAEQPMALPGWTTLYEVKVMGAVLARVSARPGLDLSPYSR